MNTIPLNRQTHFAANHSPPVENTSLDKNIMKTEGHSYFDKTLKDQTEDTAKTICKRIVKRTAVASLIVGTIAFVPSALFGYILCGSTIATATTAGSIFCGGVVGAMLSGYVGTLSAVGACSVCTAVEVAKYLGRNR